GSRVDRHDERRPVHGLFLLQHTSCQALARHLHDPRSHQPHAGARPAACLSRLLGEGIEQDGLQDALPAAGTPDAARLGTLRPRHRHLKTPFMNDHQKGLALTTLGGLALSFDVPLVSLGQGDVWSVIALRSVMTFAACMTIWLLLRFCSKKRPVLVPGKAGVLAGLCYGISTMTFLGAVFNTATANVVFIVAFTPMFAALFCWL